MADIVIVGAGMGGLTLAQLLKRQSPQHHIRIYERDAGAEHRKQGYSLGLRETGGLPALERLDLLAATHKRSVPMKALSFHSSQGRPLATLRFREPNLPLRVPRPVVREALLQGLSDHIQFGAQVVGYSHETRRPVIHLHSGESVVADVVVACDGVHSAIRRQMIGDTLEYTGLSSIQAALQLPHLDHPWNVSGTHLFELGQGISLFFFCTHNTMIWSITHWTPEHAYQGFSPTELKAKALELSRTLTREARTLIESTPECALITRDYHSRPPLARAYDGRVLLLGDAAHPMTPFQGQGANIAMADALNLAATLETSPTDFDRAICRYEGLMRKRGNRYQQQSLKAARGMHAVHPAAIALRNLSFRVMGMMLDARTGWSHLMNKLVQTQH